MNGAAGFPDAARHLRGRRVEADAEIVGRLNSEIVKILARPDIKQLFSAQALEPGALTAPQFADYVKAEVGRWGKLIQEAGIK